MLVIAVDNATIPGSAISSLLASKVIMPSASNGGADLGTVYTRGIVQINGMYLTLERNGNHVIAYYFGNMTNLSTAASENSGNGTPIPYGYRPNRSRTIGGTFTFGQVSQGYIRLIIDDPSGTNDSHVSYTYNSAGQGTATANVWCDWYTADPITPVLGDSKIVMN